MRVSNWDMPLNPQSFYCDDWQGWDDYLSTGKPRRIHQGFRTSLEDHVATAETLASQNEGCLPSPQWLQANGHHNLRVAMAKSPAAFSHLTRRVVRPRTLDDWVREAEMIAEEYDGVLPSMSRLEAWGGREGLLHQMRRHPERFSHIPQEADDPDEVDPEEWVLLAEKVAAKFRGLLPDRKRMIKQYPILWKVVTTNRQRFKHLISRN